MMGITIRTAVMLAVAAMPLASQSPAYRAPRADGGKPDLNGIWQALNEANYDLEGHNARPAMALRPGPYGPVPAAPVLALGAVGAVPPSLGVVEGGEIPYKPEALAKKKENQENWLTRDPEIKCYLPGVPRATYMPQPFRIFQSASQIFIAYQYAGAVRNIYLKDPGPAPVDSWMGQSVGHWEGETLVVDVTGLNDQTLVRSRREFSQRRAARGGALHAHQSGCDLLRSDDRGSQGLHASLEDQHAAVPAPGEERAASGFQVRGVRGRVDVWPVAQEAAEPSDRKEVLRCGIDSSLAGVPAMAALLLWTAGPAAAQTPEGRAKTYSPPRMADGHPDLQGTYDLATLTPLERPPGAHAGATRKEEAHKLESGAQAQQKGEQRRRAASQGDRDRAARRAATDRCGAGAATSAATTPAGSIRVPAFTVVNGETAVVDRHRSARRPRSAD